MAKVTKLQAAIDRIQGDIDILEAAKARLVAEVDRTAKKVVKTTRKQTLGDAYAKAVAKGIDYAANGPKAAV
jgi:hypothetical protein